MAKALNDFAPIQSGIMCTIHAYTGDQMILDGPQRKGDLRRARAGAVNIVPNTTGAVIKTDKEVTVDAINAAMKAEATESFGYNEDLIVSSDIVGMRYGSLFDSTQTMVLKVADDTYEVQVVSWYDNENSYTSQMVRTIKYFSELG